MTKFYGSSHTVSEAVRARMTTSWHPGCPVPIADLRVLTLDFWSFDGRVHRGELMVHKTYASAVIGVFGKLFDARFPITRMELIDAYEGNDDRSMAANNTSGFNCRKATASSNSWSEHAYGRAIDIDPIQNPFIADDGSIRPPAGARYVDRSQHAPGMILESGIVVRAFAAIGWRWGRAFRDYQHFSATGT